MSKHTPGPWFYCYTSAEEARNKHPGTDGGGADGSIYAKTGKRIWGIEDTETIAFLPHHRDPEEDKIREANARLIAAAPEMYAVLSQLLLTCELNTDDLTDNARALCEDGRAVLDEINKAKGESHAKR